MSQFSEGTISRLRKQVNWYVRDRVEHLSARFCTKPRFIDGRRRRIGRRRKAQRWRQWPGRSQKEKEVCMSERARVDRETCSGTGSPRSVSKRKSLCNPAIGNNHKVTIPKSTLDRCQNCTEQMAPEAGPTKSLRGSALSTRMDWLD